MPKIGFVFPGQGSQRSGMLADMIEQHKLLATVAQLVDDGTIINTANESFGALSPESLQKAHALLESGKAIGKITFDGIAD